MYNPYQYTNEDKSLPTRLYIKHTIKEEDESLVTKLSQNRTCLKVLDYLSDYREDWQKQKVRDNLGVTQLITSTERRVLDKLNKEIGILNLSKFDKVEVAQDETKVYITFYADNKEKLTIEFLTDLITIEEIELLIRDIIEETSTWEKGAGEHSVQTKGTNSRAYGEASVAEGDNTVAHSFASHTEGSRTSTGTNADYAHAEGIQSSALGVASHAEGAWTVTNNPAEHAEGRYNVSHTSESTEWEDHLKTIHSIGIGKAGLGLEFDSKNAVEVMLNGDMYVNGIGGYDGVDIENANTLQEVIENKQDTLVSGTNIKTINSESIIGSGNIKVLSVNDIIDGYTSIATDKALSAAKGKDLNDRLNNVESRGRFLSTWDCTTGKPETEPTTLPYTYKTGDYYIIGVIGTTNYKPNGSSYTGEASTTLETNNVEVNDTYLYDGTNWILQKNTETEGTVRYDMQQDLTDLQKQLAKNNIDVEDKIFVAEYGVTTFNEIKTVYNAGKKILAKRDMIYHVLTYINDGEIIFTAITHNGDDIAMEGLRVNNDDLWFQDFAFLAAYSDLAGKVDKVTGKGLSTNDYTNADKAIVGGVTAALAGKQNKLIAGTNITIAADGKTISSPSELFFAEYNVTSFEDIAAAYNAGKSVFVKGDGEKDILSLVRIRQLSPKSAIFTRLESEKKATYILCKVEGSATQWSGKEETLATSTELSGKQDTISDLATIRSGAGRGATALQPADIAAWAKQPNKPTYTASEVGALPSSTEIPSKTSDLTNDSDYTTQAYVDGLVGNILTILTSI